MVIRLIYLTHPLIWLTTTIFGVIAGKDGTIRIPWTTDPDQHGHNGAYGPNGPWQALAIPVGDKRSISNGSGVYQPMWPSMYWVTRVLTARAGGKYMVNSTKQRSSPAGPPGWWEALGGRGEQMLTTGGLLQDFVQLGPKTAGLDPVNSTIWAISEPVYFSSNQTPRYSLKVGSLGLGVPSKVAVSEFSSALPATTLLQALISKQKIKYEGFSVHLGSVALRQPGSLILGGYEQHRVLGQVGAFHFDQEAPSATNFEVVDIQLRTQIGTSPYSRGLEDEGSIWAYSPNVDPGPFRARPSFELPYIYIPDRALATLSKRLPLKWSPDLDLWLWNTTHPDYQRITRSSAYLGFVIRDINVHQIVIKVPLRLLVLTLEPPMVPTPIPYFPCSSIGTDSDGVLGRAFLQAAFFAADFQQNLTFLGQAPGPYKEGSSNAAVVVDSIPGSWRWGQNADVYPQNTTVKPENNTNPIEEFEKTWFSENGTVLMAGSDDGATEPTDNAIGGNDTAPVARSFSTAEIIGISVGIVSGVVVLGLAGWVWHLYRKQRSGLRAKRDKEPNPEDDKDAAVAELGVEKDKTLYEMDTDTGRPEIDGLSIVVHEAPDGRYHAELPDRRFSTETRTTEPHGRLEGETRESSERSNSAFHLSSSGTSRAGSGSEL